MDNIPDLRPLKISYFHLSSWKHLKGLHFPRMTDSRISLLIGANISKAHWVLDQRKAGSNEPYAIKGPLRWVILGPMSSTTKMTEESKDTLSNNTTVASASPLHIAPMKQICLLLNLLCQQKQRTPKLKLPHSELVFFPRKRFYKKAPERQIRGIPKRLVSWICFPCPLATMQAQPGVLGLSL